MSIAYAVEPWEECWQELQTHWIAHWKEVAVDQESIALNPDLDTLHQMAASRMLHVVTVRADGVLVGYHLAIIRPHLHYKQSLSAFTDIYYVAPEHRKGLVGYRLFQFVEQALKERGVQKMFTGTKLHLDMSRLFERLGWRETERLFTKVLQIGD